MQAEIKLLLIAAAIPILLLQHASAFAAQPYVAVNSNQSVIKSAAHVHGQASFAGTTLTGISSSGWVGSVMSTAGWSSSTATDPDTYIFQNGAALFRDGHIKGDAEIWKMGAQKYDCDLTLNGCPTIGQFSTTASIYQVIAFNDINKTQIRFHYETYKNDGSATVYTDTVAYKSVYDSTDPTTFFSAGQTTRPDGKVVKYYQFGVEQPDATNTGWKVKSYNMGYGIGTTNYDINTSPAYAIKYYGTLSDANNSIVTYSGSTYAQVGTQEDNSVGSDYNLKNSSVPKGESRWFYTTDAAQKIARGTQLWN